MNTILNKKLNSSVWVPLLSSVLSGWNIGLLTTFLCLIGISIVFKQMIGVIEAGSSLFILVIVMSVVFGLCICVLSGIKLFRWFNNRTKVVGYILLSVLIIFTILSFPLTFHYSQ